MEQQPEPTNRIELGLDNLRAFFIDHLNVIYSAKAHLVDKLPVIAAHVHYRDLHEGILETVSDVHKQMARLEMVMTLMEAKITTDHCAAMVGMIDDVFSSIQYYTGRDRGLRDLSIANYMQQIESIEMASFQILEMAAVKLKDKQVKQLLKECYNEARTDRTLMLLIATKYITAK
jgi:ferritin-like metal-binding protein YciE